MVIQKISSWSKVVKSLNLKASKHSNPYKISWINRGIEMPITEVCKVTFFNW